jgi:predicted GNAT family N-acyltransferase
MLEEYVFKAADAGEREVALGLRREVYSKDVGHAPDDASDDRARHFVAKTLDGDLVAAFRVLGPEERPFDLEKYVSLQQLVPPPKRAALIGRLCIRHDYRPIARSVYIQTGMLRIAHEYASRNAITDFVMFTFPYLRAFYRSAYFSEVGLTFEHPGYRSTMHVMHLDLMAFRRRYESAQAPRLARYLLADCPPNVIL